RLPRQDRGQPTGVSGQPSVRFTSYLTTVLHVTTTPTFGLALRADHWQRPVRAGVRARWRLRAVVGVLLQGAPRPATPSLPDLSIAEIESGNLRTLRLPLTKLAQFLL